MFAAWHPIITTNSTNQSPNTEVTRKESWSVVRGSTQFGQTQLSNRRAKTGAQLHNSRENNEILNQDEQCQLKGQQIASRAHFKVTHSEREHEIPCHCRLNPLSPSLSTVKVLSSTFPMHVIQIAQHRPAVDRSKLSLKSCQGKVERKGIIESMQCTVDNADCSPFGP